MNFKKKECNSPDSLHLVASESSSLASFLIRNCVVRLFCCNTVYCLILVCSANLSKCEEQKLYLCVTAISFILLGSMEKVCGGGKFQDYTVKWKNKVLGEIRA